MKRLIALVLTTVCIVCLIGCGKQPQTNEQLKDLPIQKYPLSKETIEVAIEKVELPSDLTITEEDVLLEVEDRESTLYVLRHPTTELFDGLCMNIISHNSDESVMLGISVASIDKNEEYTREEVEKAIRFATYLFWQDEDDTRLYDLFIKEYDAFIADEEGYRKAHGASSPCIEGEIDGVQYIIAYTPIDEQLEFKINFEVSVMPNDN